MPSRTNIKPSNYRVGLVFDVPYRLRTVKPKCFTGRTYTVMREDEDNVWLYTRNWMDGRLWSRQQDFTMSDFSEEILETPLQSLNILRLTSTPTPFRQWFRSDGTGNLNLWRVSWEELLKFCPVTDTDYKSGLSKFYSKHGYMEVKEPEFRLMETSLERVPY